MEEEIQRLTVSRMLERIYYVQSVQYHPIPDTASIANKFSKEV